MERKCWTEPREKKYMSLNKIDQRWKLFNDRVDDA